MEGIVVEETGPEAFATATSPESDTEQKLADEIRQLWAVHTDAQATVKKTKAEIKAIRQRLSERLFEMKQLLARPGRNGEWSPWLKQQKINRATADRLVRRFEANLPGDESPHEAISEPTKADMVKLLKSVWPPIKRALTTPESVLVFLGGVAKASGLRHEWRKDGLMLFRPDAVAAAEAAAAPVGEMAADAGDVGSGAVA